MTTLEQVRDQLAATLEGYAGPLPVHLRLDYLLLAPSNRRLAGRVLRHYARSLNAVLERQSPHLHITAYDNGVLTVDAAPTCTDCGGTETPGISCWRCQEQWEIERELADAEVQRAWGSPPMTTPHAPEGGEVAAARAAIITAAVDAMNNGVLVRDLFEPRIEALIHAAATAERARLAGMASEEDRAMVEGLWPPCPERRLHERWKHSRNVELANAARMCTPNAPCRECIEHDAARTTLLATLTARRAAVVEEALTWAAGAVCLGCSNGLEYRSGWHYTDELLATRQEGGSPCEAEAIRDRIRALSASPASAASIPRGPERGA